jgi:hypothetical protein
MIDQRVAAESKTAWGQPTYRPCRIDPEQRRKPVRRGRKMIDVEELKLKPAKIRAVSY